METYITSLTHDYGKILDKKTRWTGSQHIFAAWALLRVIALDHMIYSDCSQ